MKAKKKIGILLLIIIVAVTITATIIHSQNSNDSTSLKQKTINQDDIPIAKFNASLPTDVKEKSIRVKRNKRGNLKLGPETGVYDPKRFMLTEERNSSYGGFASHTPVEPAIPAAQSDVVITGKITKAEAFLTEDKVSIYSEFTVNVNSILKNSTSEDVNIGDSITINRGGGAVRFPSGKVIRDLFDGKPMPHVGSKYVFFLKYEAEGKDYPLITAYELQDRKLIPLDGLQRDGNVVEQLAPHQSYKDMFTTDFLNLVQQAISNSENLYANLKMDLSRLLSTTNQKTAATAMVR